MGPTFRWPTGCDRTTDTKPAAPLMRQEGTPPHQRPDAVVTNQAAQQLRLTATAAINGGILELRMHTRRWEHFLQRLAHGGSETFSLFTNRSRENGKCLIYLQQARFAASS